MAWRLVGLAAQWLAWRLVGLAAPWLGRLGRWGLALVGRT
jgi:hypothetical protein